MNWILSHLVVWRLALLSVAFLAIGALTFHASFPYWETLLEPEGHPLLWSWGNFDGVHYLTIAKHGYKAQYTQAFFPLYPLLMRAWKPVLGSYLISGLMISHVSLVLAVFLFYKLVRLDWDDVTAKRMIWYLLLFPTAFYFVALYSESLFFLLVVGSFYAARRKRWWIAGLLGAAASATRVFGIFLLPALLLEWYTSRRKKSGFTVSELSFTIVPILLIAIGLGAYMYYLDRSFGDPLLFLHSQPAFGAQRSVDRIILLYQVFWRYTKMLATVDPSGLTYYTVLSEAASGLFYLILSLIAFKRTRASYALFGALSYISPTLTGTLSSMPRYVLMLFPSFMVLSQIKNRQIQRFIWATSAILLAVNTALFVRGYWIA